MPPAPAVPAAAVSASASRAKQDAPIPFTIRNALKVPMAATPGVIPKNAPAATVAIITSNQIHSALANPNARTNAHPAKKPAPATVLINIAD